MAKSEATRRLLAACKVGDLESVKQSISDGADVLVDTEHARKLSPMLTAVKYGQLEVLQYLVRDSGTAIDVTANDDAAIFLAVFQNHVPIVRYLVEACGQEIDLTIDDNWALQSAAMNKFSEIVNYFIEESGQLTAMLERDTLWLSLLERPVLETVAVLGYGVDPTVFPADSLLSLLRQREPRKDADMIAKLFRALELPAAAWKPYGLSEVCRKAIGTGVATTTELLDAFLDEAARRVSHSRPVNKLL